MSAQTNKEKCPLCLEVMDLTDKELKPCKCGYEVKTVSLSVVLVWLKFSSHCPIGFVFI
jgi:hypothetical protein